MPSWSRRGGYRSTSRPRSTPPDDRMSNRMTAERGRIRRWLCLLPILVACDASAQPAAEQSAADFYRGKSLSIVVGHEAGTGFDFFGRTLSRHITRHLAGNPAAVPQNMPGAGGLR